MTLTTGTRLGPYEIESLIGAGGMGVVYKARDTRLGRDVAVKVLPASFAAERDLLRRFEQEARAVAALSHPNILAIHDVGQDEGTHFLVTELLEGESLRELLGRGVPLHRKSVAYAIQIAHALAAAHSRNIAHRDLKPDNIFITRDGQVKVLDFGLAKAIASVREASPTEATMTAPGPATEAGTVMGTPSYMSPEQVRGIDVDCRTDIFSFGAVFFEMLTGVRAFKRDTAAETMTAVLNDDPPAAQPTGFQIPPALDRIIRHCLEKSPDQRFQSARDLAFNLECNAEFTPSAGVPGVTPARRFRLWYFAVAAAVIFAVGFAGWKFSPSHPLTGLQFHQLTYRRGTLTDARFTPDGQSILYTATWEGAKPEIYTVPANGNGGHSIGVADARLLAVSKSGEIAVALAPTRRFPLLSPGILARVTNGTGAPRPEIENIVAADYEPNSSALAVVRYVPEKRICQVEYPIDKALYSGAYVDNLRFSPNGRYLAFAIHDTPSDDRGNVVIVRANGEKVAVSPHYDSVQGLAWMPSGDEVWFTSPLGSGAIHAVSLSGKARKVLSVPGRLFLRDISAKGQLLAEQGIIHLGNIVSSENGSVMRDLSWLDYGYLRDISDDGGMILFDEEGDESPSYAVYVRNTDGSSAVAIGEGYGVALSRNKQWALGIRLSTNKLWLYPVGPGEPRQVSTLNTSGSTLGGFLHDEQSIFYAAREPGHGLRTWVQDLNGGAPRAVTPEDVVGVKLSPDGKWLLAAHHLSNTRTLLVPTDGGEPVPIAGLRPGDFPLGWTSDNRLYIGSDPKPGAAVMRVEKLDPHTGTRTPWRDIPVPSTAGVKTLRTPHITPDGSSYAWGYELNRDDLYTISVAP